ncbi:hypothetical protein [Streptomyces hyaluromycini]|uniref:hypothetical protein n=1 Tax=Streptomyces hyaluromycini TaxID=1377993 RepID=UPI000B5CDB11|nr:hypothetical protein [Streptomyces hyaluromycini]
MSAPLNGKEDKNDGKGGLYNPGYAFDGMYPQVMIIVKVQVTRRAQDKRYDAGSKVPRLDEPVRRRVETLNRETPAMTPWEVAVAQADVTGHLILYTQAPIVKELRVRGVLPGPERSISRRSWSGHDLFDG